MEVSVIRYMWACLCIAVLAGRADGASLVTVKAANTDMFLTYDFTLDITNRIYNVSLLNPQSQDYKVMHEEVSSALYSVYGCSTCDTHTLYQGVTSMTFSDKTGNVVVQATIRFSSDQTNSVVIKYLFLQAINIRNEINGLKINSEFTQVKLGSPPAPMNSSHPTRNPPSTSTAAPQITLPTNLTTVSTTTPTVPNTITSVILNITTSSINSPNTRNTGSITGNTSISFIPNSTTPNTASVNGNTSSLPTSPPVTPTTTFVTNNISISYTSHPTNSSSIPFTPNSASATGNMSFLSTTPPIISSPPPIIIPNTSLSTSPPLVANTTLPIVLTTSQADSTTVTPFTSPSISSTQLIQPFPDPLIQPSPDPLIQPFPGPLV